MPNYKLITDNLVWRVDDDTYFPLPANESEGFKYLAWLAEGNEPEPAAPVPYPDYSAMRAQAYRNESDQLFFKSRPGRDEVPEQEWLDKVAEIKDRWPE